MQKFEETEYLELKKSTSQIKEAIISIVAILNKHSYGELYFGINNDGEVIGQQISEKTLRHISQKIYDHIDPKIFPSIEKINIDSKTCVHIKFEGHQNELYYAFGRTYIRVSDEDKRLSPYQIESIIRNKINNEKNDFIWDQDISDVTLKSIDNKTVETFLEKAHQSGRISFKVSDNKTGLKKLHLIKNNKLLNAGKVLFCNNSAIEVQLAVFAGTDKLTFIDINQKKNNIFNLLNISETYIKEHINWRVKFGKLEREEIPEVPIDALREALVNSLCHRDYTAPESNKVAIFKNRIEIYNPGNFPDGITPEDFIKKDEQSILRNPTIADILYKSKEIEKWASGLKRIYNECRKHKVKVEFKCLKTGFMTVFYRDIAFKEKDSITKKPIKDSPKLSPKFHPNFTRISQEIIVLIKKNKYIIIKEMANKINVTERTIKNHIKKLQEQKIIKRIGPDKGGYWELTESEKP